MSKRKTITLWNADWTEIAEHAKANVTYRKEAGATYIEGADADVFMLVQSAAHGSDIETVDFSDHPEYHEDFCGTLEDFDRVMEIIKELDIEIQEPRVVKGITQVYMG